jgi:hypothetical protein
MRIPGVKFEKDARVNNRYVRIDLKKHNDAITPFLKQVGSITDNQEEDAFEKKWNTGITLKELNRRVKQHLKTLPWDK